jgi:DNA repair protein RecO (recombination protein O)
LIRKERFIILRKIQFGDHDLIVHAISSEGHRLGLLAKGAKRSRKRFGGGVLEPTHFVEGVVSSRFYDANEDRLSILQEAQLLEGFPGLRLDYARLELALFFLGLVDRVVTVGVDDASDLFRLLAHGLKAAEITEDRTLLKAQFESKLLRQQGVLENAAIFRALLTAPLSRSDQVDLTRHELGELQSSLQSQMAEYLGFSSPALEPMP